MLLLAILLLFIIVPVVEIWLILEVAELLGGGTRGMALTLLVLIIDSLIGAVLVRYQGRAAWDEFRTTLDAGKVPAREVVSGGYVLVGSTFLLLPGFLSDAVGVLFLAPPSRRFLTNRTLAFLKRRITVFPGGADSGMRDFARSNQPPRTGHSRDEAKNESEADKPQVNSSN